MDATKRCPFCAEQIPEDSVRCPFCQTDLSAVPSDAPLPPAPVPTQRAVGEGALQFSHSGSRYLLGYGPTFFGIWDRQAPGAPIRTFPRTDEGWRDAWLTYRQIEQTFVPVSVGPGERGSGTVGAGAVGGPGGAREERLVRRVSGWWWVLPIVFALLGGVIAYFGVRDRDGRKARAMLLTGIALSVVNVLLFLSSSSPR
jgi:hypothetical protein